MRRWEHMMTDREQRWKGTASTPALLMHLQGHPPTYNHTHLAHFLHCAATTNAQKEHDRCTLLCLKHCTFLLQLYKTPIRDWSQMASCRWKLGCPSLHMLTSSQSLPNASMQLTFSAKQAKTFSAAFQKSRPLRTNTLSPIHFYTKHKQKQSFQGLQKCP